MNLIKFLLFITFFILTACGGGSGGSSQSSSESNFTLSFTETKASAVCYEQSFCTATVQASYQGTPPKKVAVILNIDSQEIYFSASINETYAELMFEAFNLPVGKYQGIATIDICSDQACRTRYGSRYYLPYEFQILSYLPVFVTKLTGQSNEIASSVDIMINQFSGTDEKYELMIVMPDVATEVVMPAEFVERYQVEKISANRFTFIPPIQFSSESYSFIFTGVGYSRSFEFGVRIEHSVLDKERPPLEYQAFVAETSSSGQVLLSGQSGFSRPYYGNSDLLKSVNYLTGDGWAEVLSSLWKLDFSLTTPANYGIYEATVDLSLDDKTFSYPLVFAYSKTPMQAAGDDRATIKPSSTGTLTGSFYHLLTDCLFDTCVFEVFTTKAISNWIKNIQYTHTENGAFNYYRYEIDMEKISEIDPTYTGVDAGVVALGNTTGSDNYAIAKVPVDIHVPNVYYMRVKNAPANTVFEQTIYGQLYYFEGVEIVRLEQDSNGEYIQEGERFFHHASSPYLPTDTLSFQMPALAAGKYKLNFSGVFSKHYPEFLLQVE